MPLGHCLGGADRRGPSPCAGGKAPPPSRRTACLKIVLPGGYETVTPRGTLRGIAACRQVLQKATGDEQFAMEQAELEFEDIEGDVHARTHEIARWRETGEVAYERDFALRLTLDDERIVRIVVMPGGAPPSHVSSGSQAE
jgi:hypothetical protein